MQTPFPGMDPYLEHPTLWADVHDSLIGAIRDALVPLVAPKYYVGLQRHAYLLLSGEKSYLGKPDVTVGLPMAWQSRWPSASAVAPSGAGLLEVEVPMEAQPPLLLSPQKMLHGQRYCWPLPVNPAPAPTTD